MIYFIVIDINNHKWKNTVWNNHVFEIEIGYSNLLDREYLRSILINGKALGLIAVEKIVLPIGSKLFATIELCDGRLHVKGIDKPDNWMAHIKDSRYIDSFCDEIRDICWDENDDPDNTGEERLKRMDNEVTPDFFYEWIVRQGLNDRYISREIIDSYLYFRDWLYFVKNLDEFTYGDNEIQQYKEYCDREIEKFRRIEEAEDDFFNYQQERYRIESIYGRGARRDEYGAVFDSDGECVGME